MGRADKAASYDKYQFGPYQLFDRNGDKIPDSAYKLGTIGHKSKKVPIEEVRKFVNRCGIEIGRKEFRGNSLAKAENAYKQLQSFKASVAKGDYRLADDQWVGLGKLELFNRDVLNNMARFAVHSFYDRGLISKEVVDSKKILFTGAHYFSPDLVVVDKNKNNKPDLNEVVRGNLQPEGAMVQPTPVSALHRQLKSEGLKLDPKRGMDLPKAAKVYGYAQRAKAAAAQGDVYTMARYLKLVEQQEVLSKKDSAKLLAHCRRQLAKTNPEVLVAKFFESRQRLINTGSYRRLHQELGVALRFLKDH